MKSFFQKNFWDFKMSIFWYSLGLGIYTILIIWMFPFFNDIASEYEKIIDSYPEAFLSAFGMDDPAILNTFEGFLSVESYSLIWIIIMAIFTFSLGASSVAGEIDKGTSEFSFTFPIRRRKIVMDKFLASYLMILGVIFVNLAITVFGGFIIDQDPNIKGFLAFFGLCAALFLFLLSFANFISSLLRNKGKVFGICGGFLAASYMIHVLNGISDKISDFYFLSFFKYYDPSKVLSGGALISEHILMFIILSILFFGASLIIVEKRDL